MKLTPSLPGGGFRVSTYHKMAHSSLKKGSGHAKTDQLLHGRHLVTDTQDDGN